MKIGIMSDSHDKPSGIDGAFEMFEQQGVALILHCGDWTKLETVKYIARLADKTGIPAQGVLGNNDRDVSSFLNYADQQPRLSLQEGVMRLKIAGKQIVVYHGHHKPTLQDLLTEHCDLLCLGHSHKPRYDRIDDKLIINPGSTAFAIPRSRSWQASVAVYDSDQHQAEFFYFTPS